MDTPRRGRCATRRPTIRSATLRDLLAAYRPVPRARPAALLRRRRRLPRLRRRARLRAPAGAARATTSALPDVCLMLVDTLLVFDNVGADDQGRVARAIVARRRPRRTPRTTRAVRAHRRAGRAARSAPVRAPRGGRAATAAATVRVQRRRRRRTSAIVERAKEYIRAGDVIQVVLAQRFELPLRAAPVRRLPRLRAVNPSPYMFYLALGDAARWPARRRRCWCGSRTAR